MNINRPEQAPPGVSPLKLTIKDCGIMVEPQLGMSMDRLLAVATRAEELGFGYFFRSDHVLPTDRRRGIDSPECWTSLGVLAASTRRIGFGPMVSPIGFRNPSLLAKMACTLHSHSRGRLRLAVGAGWYEEEYLAHGYPFPDFRTRVAQFAEALEIITALVNGGRADFDGKYFSAHTDCLPRPQGHMHLTVGGRTRPVVRLAAKFADEWNTFRMPESDLAGLKTVLEESAGGRHVDVSEMGPYLIARSQAKLEDYARLQAAALAQNVSPKEVLARVRARGAPCGTVDDFVDQLAAKADAGYVGMYFQTLVPENIEMMELLADTLKGRL